MSSYGYAIDWARKQVSDDLLPTAVLGIARSTGVCEVASFGASGERAASADDFFPLFSVTKPIVAMAALREVERGRLALDDLLSNAVPEFGLDRRDTVELRHLLNHSSGIGEPPLDTPAGLRPSLITGGTDFAAGAATRYSSIAYEGVAAMTEMAAGKPWQHAVADLVTDAGAPGITFDSGCDPHPVYDAAEQGLDYAQFQSLQHPGAGAYARVGDLLALGQSLLRNDPALLHPATLAAMLRPTTTGLTKLAPYPADRGQDWGLGWNLRHAAPTLLDQGAYGHGGWAGTEFWIYPGLDVCFVLLTNIVAPARFGVNVDRLHNAVVGGTR